MSSSVLAAILIPIAVAMALAIWIFFALGSSPYPEPSSLRCPDSSGGTVRPAEYDHNAATPAARGEPLTPPRHDAAKTGGDVSGAAREGRRGLRTPFR
jgi:hypothetical protein